LRRCQQMSMGVAGQRLARRLKRRAQRPPGAATWERSKTEAALNSSRVRPSSSDCRSSSQSLIGIGAMIRIAVSPLRTQYPSASQALNPGAGRSAPLTARRQA
jgi:hypothetical protein